jgi:putative membrane-bound dehydrogenase-like protein
MTVPEGFTVELVASEPDIVNPVAMTFDERGRFWITESFEYPRKPGAGAGDRVKVLEDTDGDGKADKFTVFAEGLNIPSGIAVGHGGVWVANAPDISFMQDTDGDGKADGSRRCRHRLRPRPTRTSCPTRSPGAPTAGCTASTACSTTAT